MRIFPFSRFTVRANSMLPTLKPDQDVLCFNWAYFFTKPKIGDIVVIKYKGKEMVKRIQKTDDSPGEALAKRGRLIFVEGDNKKESTDSRVFGPISQKDIVGKVVFVR